MSRKVALLVTAEVQTKKAKINYDKKVRKSCLKY